MIWKIRMFALAISCAILATPVARAQSYPDRPVKLVHGFAVGGGTDTVARMIGAELSKQLGQPLVVESRPGAGSTIAAVIVSKAPPDGYTLYIPMSTHAISGAIFKALPYDPVNDFEMVSTVYEFPMVIAVRSDSQYQSLSELLSAARLKPGSITYGTSGIGTPTHLVGELLSSMAGVKLVHVPYKGETPVVTDLLGGNLSAGFIASSGASLHMQAGKIKALAVTGGSRIKIMPDVPTVNEVGVPGFEVSSWLGVAAPAGTPRPIIDRLNAEVRRVLQIPEIRTKLEGFGGIPKASTPEEMRARVDRELKRWKQVVAEANIPQQ